MTPDALYARAHQAFQEGRLSDALSILETLVSARPGHAHAWNLAGAACDRLQNPAGAAHAFARAAELGAGVGTLVNLGLVQQKLGDLAAAESSFLRALALQPGVAGAWLKLGALYELTDRPQKARDAYARAASADVADPRAVGDALALARAQADWSDPALPAEWLRRQTAAPRTDSPPLFLLALPEADANVQRDVAARFAQSQWSAALALPPLRARASRAEGRRLRVGYLSSDFRSHAVAFLALEAIEAHDPAAVEVSLYSHGPIADDGWRVRAMAAGERFVDLNALDDAQAARRIAADAPDILVALNGYTLHARMGILAHRPAPVQASWLGYIGTLGEARLADYVIGDSVATPRSCAGDFSEALALMPRCFQPNGVLTDLPPPPPRTQLGLPDRAVVFCSFNQAFKLHPALWDAWCGLLREVPDSVLWLATPKSTTAITHLRREAASRGVDAWRLVFAPHVDRDAHIARLQAADIALDTYPYNSGTTASDALRAGVPILAFAGETFAGRMAASLLHAAGLHECIGDSAADAVAIAARLARDRAARDALRARVRAAAAASGLFEPVRFARELEHLYARMHAQALEGHREAIDLSGMPIA